MATGLGTAIIDFGGGQGSNEATVIVTGQSAISVTSKCHAYFMGDDTTPTHSAEDHRYAAALMGLTCGTPTALLGFTIHARSFQKLTGQFSLRFVWAD